MAGFFIACPASDLVLSFNGHDASARGQKLLNFSGAQPGGVDDFIVVLRDRNHSQIAGARPGDQDFSQRRPRIVFENPGPESGVENLPRPGHPAFVGDAGGIKIGQP